MSDRPEVEAVFAALADPTRRTVLDRLAEEGPLNASQLATGFPVSRQAVAKHLAILETANLVAARKQGREKLHYLNPVPINQIAERWIGKFERGRLHALSALKGALEDDTDG